jgi:hypothetical protein
VTLSTKPHLVNNDVGVCDGLDGIGVLRDFNISAIATPKISKSFKNV